jgi:hypothetical protein
MPERTKRGEEDRKREDEEMTGEPVDANETATAGTQAANTTKDKGVEPARQPRRRKR